MLLRFVFLLSFAFLVVSCNKQAGMDERITGFASTNSSYSTGNYYLDECVALLRFSWDSRVDYGTRESVLTSISEELKRVIIRAEYPIAFGHTSGSMTYFMVYYYDNCENRESYTQDLASKHFQSQIKDFPAYEVHVQGVVPGFDVVTPVSDLWKQR